MHATLAPVVQVLGGRTKRTRLRRNSTAARSITTHNAPLADLPGVAPDQTATVLAGLTTYPRLRRPSPRHTRPARPRPPRRHAAPPSPAAPAVTAAPAPARFVHTGTDPRLDTSKDAEAAGYGPYRSRDTEYGWYRNADGDGIVCE